MARLTDLLDCVRVAEVRPHDIELLEARVIQSDHKITHIMHYIFLLKMKMQVGII